METKPCILCDRQLEPATPYGWKYKQPYYGGEVRFIFSYGSTKFDKYPHSTIFTGYICDDCAEKCINKMQEKIPKE